jgi:hypothetical protein
LRFPPALCPSLFVEPFFFPILSILSTTSNTEI